jgi:SOS-response transcriptional repressor LexA
MAKRRDFVNNDQEAGSTPTDGSTSGFPSPAADYLAPRIDFNELLVPRPSSTIFAWLKTEDKIWLAVVDRSLPVKDGCQVVAWDNNEWYIKRFKILDDRAWLCSLKGNEAPVLVNPDEPYQILGRISKLVWTNP